MIKWGITSNAHDAALAVVNTVKGDQPEILFAAHAERSSGKKNDAWLNQIIVNQARLFGRPEEIHWYENFNTKRLRQIRSGQWKTAWNKEAPWKTLGNLGVVWPTPWTPVSSGLVGGIGAPSSIPPSLHYHKHHASHAAAGYFTS